MYHEAAERSRRGVGQSVSTVVRLSLRPRDEEETSFAVALAV